MAAHCSTRPRSIQGRSHRSSRFHVFVATAHALACLLVAVDRSRCVTLSSIGVRSSRESLGPREPTSLAGCWTLDDWARLLWPVVNGTRRARGSMAGGLLFLASVCPGVRSSVPRSLVGSSGSWRFLGAALTSMCAIRARVKRHPGARGQGACRTPRRVPNVWRALGLRLMTRESVRAHVVARSMLGGVGTGCAHPKSAQVGPAHRVGAVHAIARIMPAPT